MRIFVTGGAGYIGSVCSELLLNEGHEVAIFDNLIEGHRRARRFPGAIHSRRLGRPDANRRCAFQHAPGCGDALRRIRTRARIHARSVEIFSQQHFQRLKSARCNGGNGCSTDHFFIDLRDFRTARANAHRRNRDSASDQSVRRIETGLRENSPLVRSRYMH